jgi:hypothetical protein
LTRRAENGHSRRRTDGGRCPSGRAPGSSPIFTSTSNCRPSTKASTARTCRRGENCRGVVSSTRSTPALLPGIGQARYGRATGPMLAAQPGRSAGLPRAMLHVGCRRGNSSNSSFGLPTGCDTLVQWPGQRVKLPRTVKR